MNHVSTKQIVNLDLSGYAAARAVGTSPTRSVTSRLIDTGNSFRPWCSRSRCKKIRLSFFWGGEKGDKELIFPIHILFHLRNCWSRQIFCSLSYRFAWYFLLFYLFGQGRSFSSNLLCGWRRRYYIWLPHWKKFSDGILVVVFPVIKVVIIGANRSMNGMIIAEVSSPSNYILASIKWISSWARPNRIFISFSDFYIAFIMLCRLGCIFSYRAGCWKAILSWNYVQLGWRYGRR